MLAGRMHGEEPEDCTNHIFELSHCKIGAWTAACTVAKWRPVQVHGFSGIKPSLRLPCVRGQKDFLQTALIVCCSRGDDAWRDDEVRCCDWLRDVTFERPCLVLALALTVLARAQGVRLREKLY